MEIWKEIKDYEGSYMVSNLGRVKSLDRKVLARYGKYREIKGAILNLTPDKDGYLKVNLKKNQKGKSLRVHRLVADAFLINSENKPQVNHINGVKNDNNIKNLEWVTLSENRKHAYDTGLQNGKAKRGVKSNFNKLSESQVIEIKNTYKKGVNTYKDIAEKFNVSRECVGRIIRGKNWAWI